MVGAAFAPIFYLTFVIHFLDLYKQKYYKTFLWCAVAINIFFVFVDIFSSGIVVGTHIRPSFPYAPTGGILFIPFLIMFFGYVIYASYLLIKNYRGSSNITKLQIKYMFIGITVAFIGGSTNYFLFFNIPIKPYLMIFVVAYPIFISYAILRHRLMDITIAVKKGVAYSISLVLVLALYVGFIFVLKEYSERFLQLPEVVAYIIITLLIAAGFLPLKKYFDRFFESLLVRETVDAEESLHKIAQSSERVKGEEELHAFLEKSAKEIQRIVKAEHVGFYYFDYDNNYFYKIYDKNEPGPNFSKDTALYKEITEKLDIIVKEELPYKIQEYTPMKSFYETLSHEMDSLNAEVICPMVFASEVRGFIYIGKKVKGKAFTTYDFEYLERISKQVTRSFMTMGAYLNLLFGITKP